MPVQVVAESVDEGHCDNMLGGLVHIRRTGVVGR